MDYMVDYMDTDIMCKQIDFFLTNHISRSNLSSQKSMNLLCAIIPFFYS